MGGKVNQTSMYSVNVSYGNWGKIGGYTTSMNGTDTFMYPTTNLTSTHFAPESSVNNGQTTNYDFGINGSLRRKENNEATEYYLFNAFNCMKAYSYNAERYGYYGYDASGERTYKMDINFLGVWTNELEEISDNWEMEKMMLYPNGYLNMNQNGEYTKHYYADALRIASKIGRGFDGNICDSVIEIENDYPNYLDDRMTDQNTIMMSELYETTQLASPQGSLNFVNPYPDLCNLQGNAQETELFYYHPDHLGSTGMVTDKDAYIQQGFLYAPFGEIIAEYGWQSPNIPKYAFNAKEFDEENGMYYYSARYYAPPTFISRDPMFEKYPSISPYTYCANNPVLFVDPTGEDWYRDDESGSVFWQKGNNNFVDKDGVRYRNIGETYSTYSDGIRTDYGNNGTDDVIRTTEVNPDLNIEGGQYIPKQFTTDDGTIVKVDNTSYKTKDKNNADNAINKDAVTAFIKSINSVNSNSEYKIRDVQLSATTNGDHSKGSSHYIGKGIDICSINKKLFSNLGTIIRGYALQTAIDELSNIKQNLGPFLHRAEGHSTHIHMAIK